MKVRELIDILKSLDSEAEVIMAKDDEGNGFSPLDSYDIASYRPTTTWYGERFSHDMAAEAPPEDAVSAVFLWPVN